MLAAGPTQNIFRTLARHPGLFRKWMPFGGKLLNGKLPARERELAILRVGWLCRSDYEWGQHVPIGRRAGLTEDEIARIPSGPKGSGWSELDRAILSATDELHESACIADATWVRLAAEYDEKQLIELVMCVGQYHLVSFALNTFGVQREEGVVGFPDVVTVFAEGVRQVVRGLPAGEVVSYGEVAAMPASPVRRVGRAPSWPVRRPGTAAAVVAGRLRPRQARARQGGRARPPSPPRRGRGGCPSRPGAVQPSRSRATPTTSRSSGGATRRRPARRCRGSGWRSPATVIDGANSPKP